MPCTKLRFLVIEDDELQRLALVQLLDSMGASAVHDVEDGTAALKVIQDAERPVDIIITDLSMPGMDGMEFVRHLSEIGTPVSLVVVSALDIHLLSAVGNMVNAYEVKLLGALVKPATIVKLTALIEKHRIRTATLADPQADFSLAEIAGAWVGDEFEPWFEPSIDLRTGNVCGMTASPRWCHPVRGTLEAATFLPSIQARNLNDDFVWLMLQKSAAKCCRWNALGFNLVVTVRLSLYALTDAGLATKAAHIVEKEGLAPSRMVLSVAESDLKIESPVVLENLARLRMLGFGLCVDNFGEAQMARDRLSLVAFTQLKIKGASIGGSECNSSMKAGLAAALEVAQHLELKTVAAGIGSKEDLGLLHAWGCDLGQGPFIAGPMAGAQVTSWLRNWQLRQGKSSLSQASRMPHAVAGSATC